MWPSQCPLALRATRTGVSKRGISEKQADRRDASAVPGQQTGCARCRRSSFLAQIRSDAAIPRASDVGCAAATSLRQASPVYRQRRFPVTRRSMLPANRFVSVACSWLARNAFSKPVEQRLQFITSRQGVKPLPRNRAQPVIRAGQTTGNASGCVRIATEIHGF